MALIRTLQTAIKTRLEANTLIAAQSISVYTRLDGEIQSLMDDALGQTGIAVYVQPPAIRSLNPNVSRARCELRCSIEVVESPILNQTETNIDEVIEAIIAADAGCLLMWAPTIDGYPDIQPFAPAQPFVQDDDQDGILITTLSFATDSDLLATS